MNKLVVDSWSLKFLRFRKYSRILDVTDGHPLYVIRWGILPSDRADCWQDLESYASLVTDKVAPATKLS